MTSALRSSEVFLHYIKGVHADAHIVELEFALEFWVVSDQLAVSQSPNLYRCQLQFSTLTDYLTNNYESKLSYTSQTQLYLKSV